MSRSWGWLGRGRLMYSTCWSETMFWRQRKMNFKTIFILPNVIGERSRRRFGGIFIKIPKVTTARSSLISNKIGFQMVWWIKTGFSLLPEFVQTSGPEFVTGPEFVQLPEPLRICAGDPGQTVARIWVPARMQVLPAHKLREVLFVPFSAWKKSLMEKLRPDMDSVNMVVFKLYLNFKIV